VAVFAPFTVYRLLAFVGPGTNAGAAARANLSRLLGTHRSVGREEYAELQHVAVDASPGNSKSR
jgi:hypothetical protein